MSDHFRLHRDSPDKAKPAKRPPPEPVEVIKANPLALAAAHVPP